MEGFLLFFIIGVVAVIFVLIYNCVLEQKRNEKQDKDNSTQKIEEYETNFFNAEVISGRVKEYSKGEIRAPRYCVDFFVTFLINGEEKEYLVPHEIFETMQKGQKGRLVTKNNVFISFDKE